MINPHTSHACSECGQPHIVKNGHREHLNQMKATMLRSAAGLVIDTGVNRFKKRDVPGLADNPTLYNNIQKLRYHGLLAQVKVDGVKVRDEWCVTRNGWAFLKGSKELPKWVGVKDNHTMKDYRSEELVGFRDVLIGADYLETQFEYFDDDGHMVGLRPAQPPTKPIQASLL